MRENDVLTEPRAPGEPKSALLAACGDIVPTSIHWATLSSRSSEKVSLR